MGAPQKRRIARRRPVLPWILAVVAIVLLFVFVVPWLMPVRIAPIQSDSQAVGFSNRTAMIGLAAGVFAMFLLARRNVRTGVSMLISTSGPAKQERVSPKLVVATILVTFLVVAALGAILQDQPVGDAGYFIDRLLRVTAGGAPYSQIEFSYGPILIYSLQLSWRLLAWTGLSAFTVYYGWVAAGYALGLMLTAYLLNRLQVTRTLRNVTLVVIGGMTLLLPSLGVNYSALRFLPPYALLLWVLGRRTASTGGTLQGALALLAVMAAAGVSPEMGGALLVGLVVSLAILARDDKAHLRSLLILLSGIALVGAVLVTTGAGTVVAFAGGAYYFPVLPGPPAIAFVGTMLLLAWEVGAIADTSDARSSAIHVGWLAIAVVLIAPALGRADVGHVFWNGLGASLACMAVVHQRWGRAGMYLGATATAFAGVLLAYTIVVYVPALTQRGVHSVLISRPRAVFVANTLNQSPEVWVRRWTAEEAARTSEHLAAEGLKSLRDVSYPGRLKNEVGTLLAESGQLVPGYYSPASALSAADFQKAALQLEAARTMVLPTQSLSRYLTAAKGGVPDSDGVIMKVPVSMAGRSWWGTLTGVPTELKPRYAVLDPAASFGALLKRDWVAEESFGVYTVLRRR